MPPDGPWLAPSTWRSGKKAMKNKSRCHLLSGFRSAVITGGRETIQKLFPLPPADVLSQLDKLPSYSFSARLADCLLSFICCAFSLAFAFEVGIADQFSGLVLDRSLDLF